MRLERVAAIFRDHWSPENVWPHSTRKEPMALHDSTAAILELFEYRHLPEHLQAISRPFAELANQIAHAETERGAEQTTALRKLLEAKATSARTRPRSPRCAVHERHR